MTRLEDEPVNVSQGVRPSSVYFELDEAVSTLMCRVPVLDYTDKQFDVW